VMCDVRICICECEFWIASEDEDVGMALLRFL